MENGNDIYSYTCSFLNTHTEIPLHHVNFCDCCNKYKKIFRLYFISFYFLYYYHAVLEFLLEINLYFFLNTLFFLVSFLKLWTVVLLCSTRPIELFFFGNKLEYFWIKLNFKYSYLYFFNIHMYYFIVFINLTKQLLEKTCMHLICNNKRCYKRNLVFFW